jgi:hypothetical protein
VCKPYVSSETEQSPGGEITGFVRTTNNCECDVDVTVRLSTGGSLVFRNLPKNGGTRRDEAGGAKEAQFTTYSYEFHCPKRTLSSLIFLRALVAWYQARPLLDPNTFKPWARRSGRRPIAWE